MTDFPNNGSIDPMNSEPTPVDRDPAPTHQADFWSRLDDALEGEPAPVRPIGISEYSSPAPKRWQSPMLVAAALLIVGLVGAVVLMTNRNSEPIGVITDPGPAAVEPAPTAPLAATPLPTVVVMATSTEATATTEATAAPGAVAAAVGTAGTELLDGGVDTPRPGQELVCEAGDSSAWGPGSVIVRFVVGHGFTQVSYYAYGDAAFSGAARWSDVSVRTDGEPTPNQLIERYLTGADVTTFSRLTQDDPNALAQRDALAAALWCEEQELNIEFLPLPDNMFADGPWKCSFDPNLGVNPLGMRAFFRIESDNSGNVQYIYEQFGNAVRDGAGYSAVTVARDQLEAMPGNAMTMLPIAVAPLGLAPDLVVDLAPVMSCTRNPAWSSDGGWFDPSGKFPAEFETAESQAQILEAGTEVSNEGYFSFQTELYDWFAYPDSGDQRCDGGLSYSIDVTDRETGATATALTNIAADRIVDITTRLDLPEATTILAACGDQQSLYRGWQQSTGPMGLGPDNNAPPQLVQIDGLSALTSAQADGFGRVTLFRDGVSVGVLDGSYTDTAGNTVSDLALPLVSRAPAMVVAEDPTSNRQIYAVSRPISGSARCAIDVVGSEGGVPAPAFSAAFFYLLAVTDGQPEQPQYVAPAGLDRPAMEIASFSSDGSLLAVPVGTCTEPEARTVDVYGVGILAAFRVSAISGDQIEPLVGGGYDEIVGVEFVTNATLAVTVIRSSDGQTVTVNVDAGTN